MRRLTCCRKEQYYFEWKMYLPPLYFVEVGKQADTMTNGEDGSGGRGEDDVNKIVTEFKGCTGYIKYSRKVNGRASSSRHYIIVISGQKSSLTNVEID